MGIFLRVSAPLRDLAFVIAWWSSCFTAARGAAIRGGGVGRVRVRYWGDFPAETLRRREVFFMFRFRISEKLCAHVQVAVRWGW